MWVDLPIIQSLDYFGGVLAVCYKWANRYAMLFGLLGLLWSGFRVMMSRMQIKDFFWDTTFKWIGFMLLMSLYPRIITGVRDIGTEIGMNAGAGKANVERNLQMLRKNLNVDYQRQKNLAEGLEEELESSFRGFQLDTDYANSEDYDDFIQKVNNEINLSSYGSKKEKEQMLEKVRQYKADNKANSVYGGMVLHALDSILEDVTIDGDKTGRNLSSSYVRLKIMLKDNNGNETCFIAPASLLKVAALCAQVLWNKQWQVFHQTQESIDSDDVNYKGMFSSIEKTAAKVENCFSLVPKLIMTLICCVVLVICVIFALMQYVMSVLEYVIISAVGAVFIPLLLFDGTKDIPKKLIPVFTSFLVKFMVITLCLMFVFNMIIQTTAQIIDSDSGMNWTFIFGFVFQAIFCFVLTQNAPKIAQTIMTGQPQLSMGEFMAGFATAGAVYKGASKAGIAGTRAGVKAGVNGAGKIARTHQSMVSAGQTASQETKDHLGKMGVSGKALDSAGRKARAKAAGKAFVDGMFAQPAKDMAKKAMDKGNAFIHGKTSMDPMIQKALGSGQYNGGGASSGGGGSFSGGAVPKHADESRNITTARNPNGVSMGVNTFIKANRAEGFIRGRDIGELEARKAAAKYLHDNGRTHPPRGDESNSDISGNLTGNIRQT